MRLFIKTKGRGVGRIRFCRKPRGSYREKMYFGKKQRNGLVLDQGGKRRLYGFGARDSDFHSPRNARIDGRGKLRV